MDIRWQPVEPGVELAVLRGSVDVSGEAFVIRYRVSVDIDVPPHWHPQDEHITIIQGDFELGLGSDQPMQHYLCGDYVAVPARAVHRTHYAAGTEVQVSGLGPFETIYLK